ncbi:MAG: DUF1826 domain-containing protein [Bacteroidota bacterium]
MLQVKYPYANAAIGSDGEVLQDIHLPSKNIAIYQRDITPLNKELSQIAEQPIECRAIGTSEEVLSALEDYFNNHLPKCTSLFDDISKILRLFEGTAQASSFRLLLTTVSTNMCRKFHTDVNDLRLLCTYMGPGTLWLPDEAIDEKALRTTKNDQNIVLDKQLIQQVNTGDVVILKGALYPESKAILHRSPTIEQSGEKRLLLRIDTNEFLSFLS